MVPETPLDPSEARTLALRAQAHLDMDNPDRARADLEATIQLATDPGRREQLQQALDRLND